MSPQLKLKTLAVLGLLCCGCGPKPTLGTWRFEGISSFREGLGEEVIRRPYSVDFRFEPVAGSNQILITHAGCIFPGTWDGNNKITLTMGTRCEIKTGGSFPVLEMSGGSLGGKEVTVDSGTFDEIAAGDVKAEMELRSGLTTWGVLLEHGKQHSDP